MKVLGGVPAPKDRAGLPEPLRQALERLDAQLREIRRNADRNRR